MPEQPGGDQRIFPPETADERATLAGFIKFHRDTMRWKCDGLTDEQLRSRPIPTSNLSALGLVRHLAEVEHSWIRRGVQGDQGAQLIYCSKDNPDGDFDDVDTADVAEAWAIWQEQAEIFDREMASRDLSVTFGLRPGEVSSIRWLYAHIIEEYARHNGHLDLIREAIDGMTGE